MSSLYLNSASIAEATASNLRVEDTTTLQQVLERVNLVTGSNPSTINYDILDGALVYYTDDLIQDSTLNFRGNNLIAINDVVKIGEGFTCVIIVSNNTPAYGITAHQIDGSPVTPLWQGGSAPTATENAVDVYSYSIIKTDNATFTVLASKVNFE